MVRSISLREIASAKEAPTARGKSINPSRSDGSIQMIRNSQEELGESAYRSVLFVRTSPNDLWLMSEVR